MESNLIRVSDAKAFAYVKTEVIRENGGFGKRRLQYQAEDGEALEFAPIKLMKAIADGVMQIDTEAPAPKVKAKKAEGGCEDCP